MKDEDCEVESVPGSAVSNGPTVESHSFFETLHAAEARPPGGNQEWNCIQHLFTPFVMKNIFSRFVDEPSLLLFFFLTLQSHSLVSVGVIRQELVDVVIAHHFF